MSAFDLVAFVLAISTQFDSAVQKKVDAPRPLAKQWYPIQAPMLFMGSGSHASCRFDVRLSEDAKKVAFSNYVFPTVNVPGGEIQRTYASFSGFELVGKNKIADEHKKQHAIAIGYSPDGHLIIARIELDPAKKAIVIEDVDANNELLRITENVASAIRGQADDFWLLSKLVARLDLSLVAVVSVSRVDFWDLQTKKKVATLTHDDNEVRFFEQLVFSEDGNTIAIRHSSPVRSPNTNKSYLTLVDRKSLKKTAIITCQSDRLIDVAVSADGKRVAGIEDLKRRVIIWNSESGEIGKVLENEEKGQARMALSVTVPNSKSLRHITLSNLSVSTKPS